MLKLSLKRIFPVVCALILACAASLSASAQTLDFERARHQEILRVVKSDIKRYYYDPAFHGVDLDARFQTADERIKNAKSVGEMSGIIAQVLVDFNDSHLFFLPPPKAAKTDYGWHMQMIGDKCFIVEVKEGSDAEAKGLKAGDEVFALDGFEPTRDNLWKMNYFYRSLRPRAAVKMEVVKPDGKRVEMEVQSKITPGKRVKNLDDDVDFNGVMRDEEDSYSKARRQRFYDEIDNLLIWKMPEFALSPNEVDEIMGRVRKRENLILDLRGNGGGRVDMMSRLVGNLFGDDVKIGDLKERKETKPQTGKTTGKDFYKGKIVVLIDSNSASASEVFARVMQLEKRATIVGDRSAGAVMTSIQYQHQVGVDIFTPFVVSVTIGDLIMKDGKSLERAGVTPEEKVLPTGTDLANRRDPALARAAEILGFKLSPDDAGKIFPAEK